MKTSESTIKLDEALAKAQGEFVNPEKNRTVTVITKAGGSYSFDYATFDSIIDMARPILSKYGISVMQFPSFAQVNDQMIATVVTRISHAGEWIENQVSGVCENNDMQKLGSAISYLCRYSYAPMLCIAGEYDDDGNSASGNHATPSERAPRAPRPVCPQCGKSEFVFENKQAPGWYCWNKPDAKKFGCGHKWDTPVETPPSETGQQLREEVGQAPYTLTVADSKYIEDSAKAFREAKTDTEARALWKVVSDNRPGPIKAALHPIYKQVLNSFAGSA